MDERTSKALVRQLRETTQAVVDETATAYTDDASLDVRAHLQAELARAGVDIDDDEWLDEVARSIRAGRHVVFERDDAGATA